MIATEWGDALLRAREHSQSGRFNDALDSLRSELEHGGSVLYRAHLASEVTDILRIQGFLKKAYLTASEALGWEVPSDTEIAKLLTVQQAYLEVAALGCYGDSHQRVESVYESTLRDLKLEEYTSTLIRIEAYRARFREISTLDRQCDFDESSTAIVDRLGSLLQHLVETNAAEDAWIIACQLGSCLRLKEFGVQSITVEVLQHSKSPQQSSLLGREILRRSIEWLQQHEDLPVHLRSTIRYEQARSLQALGKRHESEYMFKLANNDFGLLSHPYGSLEIELCRLLPDLMSKTDQVDWPQLHVALDRFKTVAPPIKIYMWLQSAKTRADPYFKIQLPWIMNATETCLKSLESNWFRADERYSQAVIAHRGGENGDAVVILNDLLQVIKPWNVPYRNGLVAQTLSRAYKAMASYEEARTWALYCTQQWASCRPSDIESAKEELAQLDLIMNPPTLEEDVEITNGQIAFSISRGLFSDAIDKCVALGARILNSSQLSIRKTQSSTGGSQLSIPERWEMAQGMVKQALTILDRLEEQDRLLQLTNICGIINTSLRQRAESNADLELYNQSIALQEGLRRDHFATQNMFQSAMAQFRIALTHEDIHRLFHKRHLNGEDLETERFASLHKALAAFQEASSGFSDVGNQSMMALTAFHIAYIQFQLFTIGRALFDDANQSLVAAQQLADERRSDLSALRTLEAIQTKQAMAREQHVKRIHQFGFWASLQSGMIELQWFWMQNGKARSVSDVLGLGSIIPERLIRDLREDQSALKLLDTETSLVQSRDSTSSNHCVEASKESKKLQDLRKTMSWSNSLQDVLGLRNGDPPTLERLQQLKSDLLPDSILVDWTVDMYGNMYVCSIGKSICPIWYPLTISLEDVQNWITENFATQESQERTLRAKDDSPLRELFPLIAPLKEASQAENLLVFCPTGILHRLPLHALNLPGENTPIILRNPIVYCASLSIFFKCIAKARSAKVQSPISARPTVIALYEDLAIGSTEPRAKEKFIEESDQFQREMHDFRKPRELEDEGKSRSNDSSQMSSQMRQYLYRQRSSFYDERDEIDRTANKIKEMLDATLLTKGEVTMTSVGDSLQRSRMVHFHGHCNFEANNVLEQTLKLWPHASTNNSAMAEEITVRDIFSLALCDGHVSLVACDSASQLIKEGDEPLGMVTALLCAGSTSVTGTLWPVQSKAGRKFSKAFFQSLNKQHGDLLDLASALQKAVCNVMGRFESQTPFYWAPFVLHGSSVLMSEGVLKERTD